MIFAVTRTSGNDYDTPCEEAESVTGWYEDRRTLSIRQIKNKAVHDGYWRNWLSAGVGHEDIEFPPHRIGSHRFVWEKNIWVIELNSLEEILGFIEKYGNIVIGKSDYWVGKYPEVQLYEIEIYDTHRE